MNKKREFSQDVGERLAPGEQAAMNTRIRDIADVNELARRVRVTVVGAKVVD